MHKLARVLQSNTHLASRIVASRAYASKELKFGSHARDEMLDGKSRYNQLQCLKPL